MPKRYTQYKDMSKAAQHRYRHHKKYYEKHRYTGHDGERWTTDEVELLKTWKEGDVALAQHLGRSIQAVQIKRTRI